MGECGGTRSASPKHPSILRNTPSQHDPASLLEDRVTPVRESQRRSSESDTLEGCKGAGLRRKHRGSQPHLLCDTTVSV